MSYTYIFGSKNGKWTKLREVKNSWYWHMNIWLSLWVTELTDDLIQIITVFANRLYGSRSKKTKTLIERITDVTRDENRT